MSRLQPRDKNGNRATGESRTAKFVQPRFGGVGAVRLQIPRKIAVLANRVAQDERSFGLALLGS